MSKSHNIINTSSTLVVKVVGQKSNPVEDLKSSQNAVKKFKWKKSAPKILKPNTDRTLIESSK